MSETKYTPTPWKIADNSHDQLVVDNARLREALEAMIAAIQAFREIGKPNYSQLQIAQQLARAALERTQACATEAKRIE